MSVSATAATHYLSSIQRFNLERKYSIFYLSKSELLFINLESPLAIFKKYLFYARRKNLYWMFPRCITGQILEFRRFEKRQIVQIASAERYCVQLTAAMRVLKEHFFIANCDPRSVDGTCIEETTKWVFYGRKVDAST